MNLAYGNQIGQPKHHVGHHPLYRGYSPSKPKWKTGPGQQLQQPQTFTGQAFQASSALMQGYMRQNSNKPKSQY